MLIMWMVVRIPAGEVTNLHYIFVVAKPLVMYYFKIRYPSFYSLPFDYKTKLALALRAFSMNLKNSKVGILT